MAYFISVPPCPDHPPLPFSPLAFKGLLHVGKDSHLNQSGHTDLLLFLPDQSVSFVLKDIDKDKIVGSFCSTRCAYAQAGPGILVIGVKCHPPPQNQVLFLVSSPRSPSLDQKCSQVSLVCATCLEVPGRRRNLDLL